jgi:4-hydroxy-3-methylbut-2-en-1-yl diphosphate synthase IspG/GcpE
MINPGIPRSNLLTTIIKIRVLIPLSQLLLLMVTKESNIKVRILGCIVNLVGEMVISNLIFFKRGGLRRNDEEAHNEF